MKPLLAIVTLLFIFPLSADDFIHLSGTGSDESIDAGTFSNTQEWSPKYLRRTRQKTVFLPTNWKRTFSIPAAPANSSPRTKAELQYLHTLVKQRPAHKADITAEVDIKNFRFGDHTFATLTEDPKFKQTANLIAAAYEDLAVVVFSFKHKHDRIRPSILDETLTKLIKIPPHPAYPSGHATEAYAIAYLLQELDPPNAERYLKDAHRIAHNREIAGVHYPSDSAAGQSLARQLTDGLLANHHFQSLLAAAKEEW